MSEGRGRGWLRAPVSRRAIGVAGGPLLFLFTFLAPSRTASAPGAWRPPPPRSGGVGPRRLDRLRRRGAGRTLGSGGAEPSAPLPVETARWIWIAQWVALGALFHSVAWRVRRSRAGLFCHVTAGACFLAVVLVAMNVTPFQLDDGRPDVGTPVASAEALTGPAE